MLARSGNSRFVLVRRVWITIDVAIVVLFVGVGRSVHDHGVNVMGMASTTWPFAVGLAIGWLVPVAHRRSGASVIDGLRVCLVAVPVGMILRVVSGQGIAAAFVLVAFGFLGATMLGWRMLHAGVQRWKAANSSA